MTTPADEGAREAWLQAKHLLRNADENPSLFILRTASFLSADEKYIAALTTELAEARRELTQVTEQRDRLLSLCGHGSETLDTECGVLTCDSCGRETPDPFHHNPGGN